MNVGLSRILTVGVRALLVGWYVQWCERRYDRARARYRRAADRAVVFMDDNDDVMRAVENRRAS